MGPTEWVLLVVLSVVWGGAFFFYKLLDNAGLPPFTIVFGRVVIAAVVLLGFVVATRRAIPRDRSVLLAFLVLGGINNVIPFGLIVFGEKHIDSGLASIFNATTPIFTALVAQWLSRDEKLTPGKIAGVVLGLAGVVLLMGPSAVHGLDLTSISQLACIAAAVAYGFGAVYARRFQKMGIDPMVTATGQLCGSTLLSLPLAVIFEHPWTLHALPAGAWWAWIGLALPSTALAFVFYFRIIATAGATNAASVTFLVPVSAVLLGTFVLGEHLAPTTFGGMALIFTGLAVLDGRLFALIGRRRKPGAPDAQGDGSPGIATT
jgi:drug/metabolite transporter (DMT)-like permease